MNLPVVAFIFGGILLKELKVPKVGTGVRVLSAIVGLLFICVGFSAGTGTSASASGVSHQAVVQADTPPPPVEPSEVSHQAVIHADPPPPPVEPVDFFLTDQLGDDEVSEQVTVLVDGRDVGNLTVNETYPTSRLKVTVPPGQHSYTAEATAVVDDQGTEYRGVGQGMINVRAGKTYSLRGSVSGNTWLVSIEEEQ